MKKLFSIIIICMLSLPIFAENVLEAEGPYTANETAENVVQENTQNEDFVKEPELPNTQVAESSQFKQPISKKKLAKKFILAMLCVAGTSVFLYAILKVYNSLRDNIFCEQITDDSHTSQSLDSPQDITEAVKSFVEKTKWEN